MDLFLHVPISLLTGDFYLFCSNLLSANLVAWTAFQGNNEFAVASDINYSN